MKRLQVDDEQVEKAANDFSDKLYEAIEKKGRGVYISAHEILGSLTEEYHEVIEAVHTGWPQFDKLKGELLDVAVVAIWGYASLCAMQEDNKRRPGPFPQARTSRGVRGKEGEARRSGFVLYGNKEKPVTGYPVVGKVVTNDPKAFPPHRR